MATLSHTGVTLTPVWGLMFNYFFEKGRMLLNWWGDLNAVLTSLQQLFKGISNITGTEEEYIEPIQSLETQY